jgi:LIVCS family branched-chain amino acid:cation transporter
MFSKSIVSGCAIFSMLFGSGNVVFPLILGKIYADNWLLALVGWLVAAVAIPMLGYYGAMLFDGDNKKYLAPLGKHLTFAVIFLIMMMVGPLGVGARIVNVAFGGIHNVAPQISLPLFSGIYTLLTVILAYNPGKVIQIIGVIFTPLKFGGVAAIVLGALYFGGSFEHTGETTNMAALMNGFNMGYQTMDLTAALFAAGGVYCYIKNVLPESERENKKSIVKLAKGACIIGGLLLAIAYLGLLLIGVQYSDQLVDTPSEEIFSRIAELAMGLSASWFVSIVIAVSCLATATFLCSAFTDYIHQDILKGKFKRTPILITVGLTIFSMSLLGFGQICQILGMILEKIYPILMVFIGCRIFYYYAVINKRK